MSKGPRLLLVHGSVVNGDVTWDAQRALASSFELVIPNRRGFPPGPDVAHVDFEDEAVWLEQWLKPRTHLVGHSYGGVIALLATARRPELVASLTVVEPPAFAVARGNPAVDAFVAAGDRLWSEGPRDPEAFLRVFLRSVGARVPPGRFSPALLQGARTLMVERPPLDGRDPPRCPRRGEGPRPRRDRRPQRRLRRGVRRPRGAPRRGASGPARRGPFPAAARRPVQRCARRTSSSAPRPDPRGRMRMRTHPPCGWVHTRMRMSTPGRKKRGRRRNKPRLSRVSSSRWTPSRSSKPKPRPATSPRWPRPA